MERENFLSRIRASLQLTVLPQADPEHPGSFAGYSFQADAPVGQLIKDFKRELETLAGHFYAPADKAAVTSTILKILGQHQAERLMAWDEEYLGLPGISAALSQAGITIENSFLPPDGTGRAERLAQLDGVKVGLTGAEAGLADTGTLALSNGPGRGKLASLLPPVHVALLPAQQLYPSLPAFLAARPTPSARSSNLVFIAGPSRSGDIELTLSIGVHGPGEVHVILIPNS